MGINIGRGKGGTPEDEDEALEAKQTVKAGESTVSLLVILMQFNNTSICNWIRSNGTVPNVNKVVRDFFAFFIFLNLIMNN